MRGRFLSLMFVLVFAPACEDTMPIGPTTPVASVNFFYQSVIPADTPFDPESIGCVRAVLPFNIHLLGGWSGFRVIDVSPSPDGLSYRAIASDVPIDTLNTVIMIDPAMCNVDRATAGAVTERVFANGVLLTTVTPVSGSANRPGLTFRVAADGTVTP